ncbi:MAG: hypothetical protein JWQ19_2120 [Subtercola sp.]|nr:hypothetical protein [Subtercola sp.]
MHEEDNKGVSRRSVVSAVGLGGVAVGAMVATGGGAWAAPLIKSAIGVPAAVSSLPDSNYIFERGEADAHNADHSTNHTRSAGHLIIYVTALNGAPALTAMNTTALVSVDTGPAVISFYDADNVGQMTTTALGKVKQISATKSAVVVGAGNPFDTESATGLFHMNLVIDPDDSTVGEPGEATLTSPTFSYTTTPTKTFTPPTIEFSDDTTNPSRPDAAYTLDVPSQITVVNSTQTSVYFDNMVEQISCVFPGGRSLAFTVTRSIPGVAAPNDLTSIRIGGSYLVTLATKRLPNGFLSGLNHGDTLSGTFTFSAHNVADFFALSGTKTKAVTFTYV